MRKKVLFLLFLIFKCLQIDATAVMPIFSVKHGLYEEPIEISLSADALSKIYYTTDCSEPTLESIPYTKPLRIDRTSILRAISVNSEGEVSDIATCSYIYPKDVVYQTNTPLGYPDHWGDFINIDGVAPADYGMDQVMIQDKNILELVLKGLYSLPIVSLVSEKDNFFGLELDSLKGGIYIYTGVTNSEKALGRGWERPVSFELFNSEYNDDNTTMCGVKLHGGNSRIPESQPKHSFRLHFKSKYGPSKLGYPIFGDEGPSNFDVLVLKSFYNNSWTHLNSLQRSRAQYMRDLWTRCMQLNMGHPSSRGRYCHLFLNGMYWGLYCISERVNSDFCKNLMGGAKKDYDVISVDEKNNLEADEGDLETWNKICDIIRETPNPSDVYNILKGYIDMDNYIDFMLLNQYAGNMDWDNHNWYAIYNKKKGKGFWFLSWDAETIFGDIDDNITSINYPNCPSSFFQKLIKSPSFMHKYIDRAHFLFSENGYLSPDYTSVVLDSLYDKIKFAIYAESARWGDYRKNVHTLDTINETYTADFHYIKERDRLRNVYLPNRTDIFKRQLQENGWYPQIEAPVMFANGRKVENGSVVNAEVLSFDTSKVYYTFDGTDPISWESDKNGVVSENTYIWEEGDYVSLPMGSVIIKAITNNGIEWSPTVTYKITNTNDTSISHLVIDKQEVSSTYNLSGQKVKSIGCGIIVTKGKKIISKD